MTVWLAHALLQTRQQSPHLPQENQAELGTSIQSLGVIKMPETKFHMVMGAPTPVAPFSHATEADEWVFVTGQLPIDPDDEHATLPPDIEAQTHLTFRNLITVLSGLGLGLEHVVSARAFLTDFYGDYDRFNSIYQSYFLPDRRPARTCIGVTGLARHARVEIDFIAKRPK